MNIADGLALTSYTRGISEDGWIGAETTLYILVYEPFRFISVSLWIPPGWSPRPALFVNGTWRREIELEPGGLATVNVPCTPPSGGMTLQISIPDAESAPPPDQRVLGAVLNAVAGKGVAPERAHV